MKWHWMGTFKLADNLIFLCSFQFVKRIILSIIWEYWAVMITNQLNDDGGWGNTPPPPPYYVKHIECLEKRYINVTNY